MFVLFCYQRYKNSFRENTETKKKKVLQAVFNDNIFIQCEFKLYTKFKYSVSLKCMGIWIYGSNLMDKTNYAFDLHIKSSIFCFIFKSLQSSTKHWL